MARLQFIPKFINRQIYYRFWNALFMEIDVNVIETLDIGGYYWCDWKAAKTKENLKIRETQTIFSS